jgi:hypothetical protein
MEGKEVRFGIASSALWATATTAASNGSVNSMHDSFTPLGGLVPMWLMQLGEVVFGGVGSGLYGMLMFAIVAVFIAGLMVGRTPEYLGKKIEAFEMKMASLVILCRARRAARHRVAVLIAGRRARRSPTPAARLQRDPLRLLVGRQQQRQRLRGPDGNTPFYNVALGLAMLVARYWVIVPVLAIAGSLARKKSCRPTTRARSRRTRRCSSLLLVGVVVLVGALTFVPALALGPIVEHLQLIRRTARELTHDAPRNPRRPLRPRDRPVARSSTRCASSTRARRSATRSCSSSRSAACFTTAALASQAALRARRGARPASSLAIALWLWFTVLFANFAEAMAEGRGKAQADSAAQGAARRAGQALARARGARARPRRLGSSLRKGDVVLVEAGESIPGDGEVIEGVASVDESADHRRERAGHPRERRRPQRVTGGTQVLSDWLVVRIAPTPARPSSTA